MFPQAITLFGVPFHLFGFIAGLSLLTGYLLTVNEMKRLEISLEIAPHLAFAVLISAFIGARVFFILINWHYYASAPLAVLKVWEGGIVLYGGLLGGLAGGYLYCLRHKLSFPQLSDTVAIGIGFGLPLSRIGCLLAGCCYGKPTHLPWGITFDNPLSLAPLHEALHPTQIYSFLTGMAIFGLLLLLRKRKTFDGELLLVYLCLTSGARVFIEDRFRAEASGAGSLIAFIIFILSGALYVYLKQRSANMKRAVVSMAVLVFAVVLYGACGIVKTQSVSRGYDIQKSSVDKIVNGKTTEQEILASFGPPTKVRDTEDGKEYFYDYAKSGGPQWNLLVSVGGNTVQKSLFVWFDKQGVVKNYAFKQS